MQTAQPMRSAARTCNGSLLVPHRRRLPTAFSAAASHTAARRRCSPVTFGSGCSSGTLSGASRSSNSRRSRWETMAAAEAAGAAGSGGGAEETDVVIVGAGLAGLGAALALQKAGKQGRLASLLNLPDQDLLRQRCGQCHIARTRPAGSQCLQSVTRSPLTASVSDISYRQEAGARAKHHSHRFLNACTLIRNEAVLSHVHGMPWCRPETGCARRVWSNAMVVIPMAVAATSPYRNHRCEKA